MTTTPQIPDKVTFPENRSTPAILITFFGILLPLVTLLIEMYFGMCIELFDPIPTTWHVLLILLVIGGNGLVLYSVRTARHNLYPLAGYLNGATISISAIYALAFAPLTPFAFLAIPFYGIGLLPLAPLFALVCALFLRRYLRRQSNGNLRVRRNWRYGLALALLAWLLVETPVSLARVGMHMASSSDSDTQLRGIGLLRSVGNEDVMLRACYIREGQMLDIFGWLLNFSNRVYPEDARKIFYRVTGETFNSRPNPLDERKSRWNFDSDTGSEDVGGIRKQVNFTGSTIDGSLDANAALGYVEWTMQFHNSGRVNEEARCQILLPQGAVVSRLTLWVDGEEREAAFGTRGQVRQAYQAVVHQRRDPVLVTTSGPDRILVQCFPIQPNGGEMQIRIGLTTPLHLNSSSEAELAMPRIIEKNFSIAPDMQHSLWLECDQEILHPEASPLEQEKGSRLRMRIAQQDWQQFAPVALRRDADAVFAHSTFPDTRPQTILQELRPQALNLSGELLLVIDGSACMKPWSQAVCQALQQLPEGSPIQLFIAGDSESTLTHLSGNDALNRSIDQLQHTAFIGGRDNGPALLAAWRAAESTPGARILWIHGSQPIGHYSPLFRQQQRQANQPLEPFSYSVSPGSNRILEQLNPQGLFSEVYNTGRPAEDLRRLFARWSGQEVTFMRTFATGINTNTAQLQHSAAVSTHLIKLWALSEIRRFLRQPNNREMATSLALKHSLVTPGTGAVVLETQAQYDAAGLEPGVSGKVPTIPEPEEWALIFITLMLLGWLLYRQRQRTTPEAL